MSWCDTIFNMTSGSLYKGLQPSGQRENQGSDVNFLGSRDQMKGKPELDTHDENYTAGH